MVDIVTLNGSQTALGAPQIAALRSGLRGAVILSGDDDYETARRVWNGNVDRRPAVIVRCITASDVQRAVDFARERDLLVSIRGGGHSAPGYGTNDGSGRRIARYCSNYPTDNGAATGSNESTFGGFVHPFLI